MTIKVSVSVTTFNQEKYIEQTLDSILMQKTNFDFEILINDDASIDRSVEIIKSYQEKYPDKIKPIFQTENQYTQNKEVHYTFNYTRAEGKYIAYCDGDDYWTDCNKLQKQFDFLEAHPDVSACIHPGKTINEQGTKILGYRRLNQNHHYLDTRDIIGLQGRMITNSLLMRNYFSEGLVMPEWFNEAHITDYPLYLILSTKGNFYYMDEIMCAYRAASKGSWTEKVYNNPENRKKHIYEMIDLLERFNEYTDYKYDDSIKDQIKHNQLGYVMIDRNMKHTNPKDFKSLYNILPLKKKIKLNILIYFPRLVGLYKKLKNNPYNEILKPNEVFIVDK